MGDSTICLPLPPPLVAECARCKPTHWPEPLNNGKLHTYMKSPKSESRSNNRIALRVKPAAERALRGGHPWLFDTAITRQSGDGRPGDLAVIFDRKDRFLAVGLFDPSSQIRVRVLQYGKPVTVDGRLFESRVRAALKKRESLETGATTGYRVVHGESEGLPGLVIDRYAQTLVIKLYSAAWLSHLDDLVNAVQSVLPAEHVVLRLSRGVQAHSSRMGRPDDGAILVGPALVDALHFQENGLWFEVDPVKGQKTGFFLDQRDNRARVERLASGRRVLNVFAYTGGFSLYAARGGARSIVSVDISRPALDAAVRNFALNQNIPGVAAAEHVTLVEDAFIALADLRQEKRQFDLVILDPPAFAKRASEVQGALDSYERLVWGGLGVLRPGGTLAVASCSSRVGAADFFAGVHRAAKGAGRVLNEIERTGHPLDHPVRFREGAYLKCLFAEAHPA